jgi:cardiolipin synthase
MMRMFRRTRPADQPPAYRRNRVELLPDGHHFFQALFDAIRTARHYILLEYYLIRSDHTGKALAAGLAEAIDRGVRVVLIYDYIGCVETPAQFFRHLARQGVELFAFNVPSFRRGIRWFDRRDHRKMTIIDGSTAFLGGFNIGDEYAGLAPPGQRFRDAGLRISGSAVRELERIFAETWRMGRDTPPLLPSAGAGPPLRQRGNATILIVSGGPHHRASYIRNAFRSAIASASEDIILVTPYFVPGPRVIRSLLRAVRRGVRVRILLPARNDVPLIRFVGVSYYTALLSGGIEIYELEHEILHAKIMLIDSERAVIGSANLDQRSFHRNFELNGIIDDRGFGRRVRGMLEQTIREARPVSLADHERRGMVSRALEQIVRLFSWFL